MIIIKSLQKKILLKIRSSLNDHILNQIERPESEMRQKSEMGKSTPFVDNSGKYFKQQGQDFFTRLAGHFTDGTLAPGGSKLSEKMDQREFIRYERDISQFPWRLPGFCLHNFGQYSKPKAVSQDLTENLLLPLRAVRHQ